MPESKKLSELIEDFVWKTMEFNQYANFRNNVPQSILGKMTDKIDYLKNQIDQKFEELRCSCEKHKLKEWKESLSLFEQVMESKKKECPLSKDWEEIVTLYAVKDFAVNKIDKAIEETRMVMNENQEKEKWNDIQNIILSNIVGQYYKYKEFPENFWIHSATRKIISSLKEYEANSTENQ